MKEKKILPKYAKRCREKYLMEEMNGAAFFSFCVYDV